MTYHVTIGHLTYVDLDRAEAMFVTFMFEAMGLRCLVEEGDQ